MLFSSSVKSFYKWAEFRILAKKNCGTLFRFYRANFVAICTPKQCSAHPAIAQ